MRVAGIDGCPAGWLRLEVASDATSAKARVFRTAIDLLADAASFDIIAVDIPIGLTEAGPRLCDQLARRHIQPRGSSVFPAPVRAALAAASYEEACQRSRAAHGKALSKQAFAILPKIREMDHAVRSFPAARAVVREVHPEVSFCIWNGGPLQASKKKPAGFHARLALVESVYPGGYSAVRRQFSAGAVANDDILDAFAALWTARRAYVGEAITLPELPPLDVHGLRMEMLA